MSGTRLSPTSLGPAASTTEIAPTPTGAWRRPTFALRPGPNQMPAALVRQVQEARLLNAIGDVCAEEGYHGTTIRKLIARSGVSRKTFYELFADKEDCYLRAYDETVEHVGKIVADAYAREGSPEQQLRLALHSFLRFCADNPALARTFAIEIVAAGPAALARRDATIDRLTDLLERSALSLGSTPELRRLKARLFVGGVHELVRTAVEAGDVASLPALTDQILAAQLPSAAAAA